jgi:hypothetical protein
MPNWKTYESSVRLLSAIIAAHPELKLNYAGKQLSLLVLLELLFVCGLFSSQDILF